jgi:superfamily I DNA/RNA helicase
MGETIYTQFQAANLPIEWLNKDAASRSYQPKLDSIKLMTMHSCKGVEFSSVIIPGLGYLPNPYSTSTDEARLLDVAMTRSTDRLILSHQQESGFVKLLQEIALTRS